MVALRRPWVKERIEGIEEGIEEGIQPRGPQAGTKKLEGLGRLVERRSSVAGGQGQGTHKLELAISSCNRRSGMG